MKEKHLTVAELIALLQPMPQDAYVYLEGTECTGEATGVGMINISINVRTGEQLDSVLITAVAYH